MRVSVESNGLEMNASESVNTTTPQCGPFNPLCDDDQLTTDDQFLALVVLALACAVCALCVLVLVLAILIHKISEALTVAAASNATEKGDQNEARKGLLGSVRSSFSSSFSRDKNSGKKSKKTSFAEDTSCAAPRDIDEEDL